jgi:hypothetical protein
MAVVFWKGSVANTNANGEHHIPSWTPSQGMSICIAERKNPQIIKRNSLLNLDFFVSCEIARLKPSLRTIIKNNNDNRQKLTITEDERRTRTARLRECFTGKPAWEGLLLAQN